MFLLSLIVYTLKNNRRSLLAILEMNSKAGFDKSKEKI